MTTDKQVLMQARNALQWAADYIESHWEHMNGWDKGRQCIAACNQAIAEPQPVHEAGQRVDGETIVAVKHGIVAQHDRTEYRDMTDGEKASVAYAVDYMASHNLLSVSAPVVPAAMVWTYCPECGCDKFRYVTWNKERWCDNCGQVWFPDIDYSEAVRANLAERKAPPPAAPSEEGRGG